jgi:branched-subunit amino acid ABC-type transport system permease component
MSNQAMILYAVAAVLLVLYLMRRRSRMGRDDD